MKKKLLNGLIGIVLIGCGEQPEAEKKEMPLNETLDTTAISQLQDEKVEAQDSSVAKETGFVEMFEGRWNLALNVENEWYQIKGCEEYYGLKFRDVASEKNYELEMNMADRMGMSVNYHYAIHHIEIDEEGYFEMSCEDLFTGNVEIIIAGVYYEHLEDWPQEVITLENNEFAKGMVARLMPEHEKNGIRIYKGNDADLQPENVDEFDCDLGFED